MSYPKRLISFRPYGGVVTDVPASELGDEYLSDAWNVRLSQGVPERARGWREAYPSPTVAPYNLISIQNPAADYWVYVGAESQWAVNRDGHTDITHADGLLPQTRTDRHSLCTLNGVPIHNNALNAPMYWDRLLTSKFVDLPDWPADTRCIKMVSHLYHLFALGIEDGENLNPSLLRWSDAAEPGTVPGSWTPSASNQAGSAELSDTPGALLTAHTLRDTLLIYKRDAIYAADFVGGDQVYTIRPLFRNMGSISGRAVAVGPQGHVFVTDDDIVMTDGNGLRSLANSRIRNRLFDNLNGSRPFDIVAFYQPLRRETCIAYPTGGDSFASEILVWSHDTDTWAIAQGDGIGAAAEGAIVDDVAAAESSWDADVGEWNQSNRVWNDSGQRLTRQILAAVPDAMQLRLVDTLDPTHRNAWIEKADMALGDPSRLKCLRRVHVRWQGREPLTLRVASRMTVNGTQTWAPAVVMQPGDQVANVRILGRFITIRFESAGTEIWRLSGFDLEVEDRGYQ